MCASWNERRFGRSFAGTVSAIAAGMTMNTTLILILAGIAAAGCGDDAALTADDAGMPLADGASATPNVTVEEVLLDFGVDIADTPRIDEDGEPLGDDYAPLGSSMTLNEHAEIELFGARLEGTFASTGAQPVVDLVPDADNVLVPTLLDDSSAGTDSWFSARDLPRDAVSGDFDGDGVDETVIVYQILNESLLLQVKQDAAEGFAVSEPQVVATQAIDEVVLAAGDFDGDTDVDLMIALQEEAGIRVTLWANDGGRFEITEQVIDLPLLEVTFEQAHVILAVGNLDRDRAHELAAMVNEPSTTPTARYFVFDDAAHAFASLGSGPATVTLPTESATARSGDIALGDVDGDGMDEVVYGGLTDVGNTCFTEMFSVVQVLDDARNALSPIAAHKVPFRGLRDACSSGAQHRVTYHPITLPDIDGDRIAEIHALEHVYEDVSTSTGELVSIYQIPQEHLFTHATSGSHLQFHANTVSFAAGDVTSDGRDDIVFYSQAGQSSDQGVQVWGLDMIDGFSQMRFLDTELISLFDPAGVKVLLSDVDLDQDSASLAYSEGSYRLVFTEPIVLAALAAPPCARDGGPSVDDACRTAFGRAVTDTMERTDSWSIIAGVSVGYEAEFSALGVKVGSAEVILNTRNEVRFYGGEAYTLTTQVVRETGVLEDSVIFETQPYDVYTYVITSHPNPELVGGELQVRLPRTPVTIMTTRDFYNANIAADGVPIDERIFQHTAGDPSTYPTVAERDALLREYTGVQSDEADVGEGSGFTEVSVRQFTETVNGREFAFEATVDFKATKLGVVGGLSLGGGAGFDISTRRGSETIYQGTVSNVAAENYPDDAISFGLFAYIVDDTSNRYPFEVINYWVVPPSR